MRRPPRRGFIGRRRRWSQLHALSVADAAAMEAAGRCYECYLVSMDAALSGEPVTLPACPRCGRAWPLPSAERAIVAAFRPERVG